MTIDSVREPSEKELGWREYRARQYRKQLRCTELKYGRESEEYKDNLRCIKEIRERGY